MRNEFQRIVGLKDAVSVYSLMETWSKWKTRIIEYSRLEKAHRPKVRELLTLLDEKSDTIDTGKLT